ncbi:MAG: hypothetical protein AB1633_07650, partial [Elusimicrobiota bacterium]
PTNPTGTNHLGIPVTLESSFTITGIVTVSTGIFGKNSFYVQDETAGTNVYDSGKKLQMFIDKKNPANSRYIQVGDSITITGLVWFYNGLLEFIPTEKPTLSTFTVTQIPGFKTITTRDIAYYGEKYEGQLVRLSSAMVLYGDYPPVGEQANIEIQDGSGISCTMRIEDGIHRPKPFRTSDRGYYLEIIGIVGQYISTTPYTSGYQLLPRSTLDIVRMSGPGGTIIPLKSPEMSIDKKVFNPYKKQSVSITINTVPGNRMTLRVFDTKGREVKILADYSAGGINQTLTWDGTNGSYDIVPPGIYILHLECLNPAAGTRDKVVSTVAVGVR